VQNFEVSIGYASDRVTHGIGGFPETSSSPTAPQVVREGLGGCQVTGAPCGSGANDFIQTEASGFSVGNMIANAASLLVGLRVGGVSTHRTGWSRGFSTTCSGDAHW
jgi:hypothetical protein